MTTNLNNRFGKRMKKDRIYHIYYIRTKKKKSGEADSMFYITELST